MRVVFTTDYYPPHIGGGVEAVVNEVATQLVHHGHHVMVVTLGRQGWPRSEILDGVSRPSFSIHPPESRHGSRAHRVAGIVPKDDVDHRRVRPGHRQCTPSVLHHHTRCLVGRQEARNPERVDAAHRGSRRFRWLEGSGFAHLRDRPRTAACCSCRRSGRGEPGGGSGNGATAGSGYRGDTQRSRSGAVPTGGPQNRGSLCDSCSWAVS